MIAAAVALVALSAILLGTATASAARDARQELRALLDEASVLSIASLLEPSTYAVLAERATRAEEAMLRLNARLSAFGPLELVPFAGGRVRAARNTAALGSELAFAGRRVIEAYGAASLATGPLVLDRQDATLSNATVGAQRSLAAVAIASPGSVDDGLELDQRLFDLQELITDPLVALTETEAAGRHIAVVRQRSARLTAELGRLLAEQPEPNETLELALDGLGIVSEAAEAAAALLSIGDAFENGFLSPAFGTETAPLLVTARDRLDEAKLRLDQLEDSFASGIGGRLAEAGVIGVGTRGVFGPAQEASGSTVTWENTLARDAELVVVFESP